jgi:hypothetical protein
MGKPELSVVDDNPFAKSDEDYRGGSDEERTKEEVEKVREEFNKALNAVLDGNVPLEQKLDGINSLTAQVIPELFKELLSPAPNVDRSVIGSRCANAIKNLASTLIEKRKVQVEDELNPYSPKFQLVFSWLLEMFHKALESEGVDEIVINNIFNSLSRSLMGWEETVSKSLKGLSAKALSNISNPLKERTEGPRPKKSTETEVN